MAKKSLQRFPDSGKYPHFYPQVVTRMWRDEDNHLIVEYFVQTQTVTIATKWNADGSVAQGSIITLCDYKKRRKSEELIVWQEPKIIDAFGYTGVGADVLEKYGCICHYCKMPLTPEGNLHGFMQWNTLYFDHKIPKSRGGRFTIDNAVPVCRHCNTDKRTRTDREYRKWLKFHLTWLEENDLRYVNWPTIGESIVTLYTGKRVKLRIAKTGMRYYEVVE